jgi:hypothetical protein
MKPSAHLVMVESSLKSILKALGTLNTNFLEISTETTFTFQKESVLCSAEIKR